LRAWQPSGHMRKPGGLQLSQARSPDQVLAFRIGTCRTACGSCSASANGSHSCRRTRPRKPAPGIVNGRTVRPGWQSDLLLCTAQKHADEPAEHSGRPGRQRPNPDRDVDERCRTHHRRGRDHRPLRGVRAAAHQRCGVSSRSRWRQWRLCPVDRSYGAVYRRPLALETGAGRERRLARPCLQGRAGSGSRGDGRRGRHPPVPSARLASPASRQSSPPVR
jgi:hypothetical protein